MQATTPKSDLTDSGVEQLERRLPSQLSPRFSCKSCEPRKHGSFLRSTFLMTLTFERSPGENIETLSAASQGLRGATERPKFRPELLPS